MHVIIFSFFIVYFFLICQKRKMPIQVERYLQKNIQSSVKKQT